MGMREGRLATGRRTARGEGPERQGSRQEDTGIRPEGGGREAVPVRTRQVSQSAYFIMRKLSRETHSLSWAISISWRRESAICLASSKLCQSLLEFLRGFHLDLL